MDRSRTRAVARLAVTASVIAILVATLSPPDSPTSGGTLLSMIQRAGYSRETAALLGHTVLFGGLGVALAIWYASSTAARRSPRRVLLMVVLAIWLLAAATELAQPYVANRDASFLDWLADMTGGLLGLFLGGALLRTVLRLGEAER